MFVEDARQSKFSPTAKLLHLFECKIFRKTIETFVRDSKKRKELFYIEVSKGESIHVEVFAAVSRWSSVCGSSEENWLEVA